MPIPAVVIEGLTALAGSQINRAQSQGDIARQNAYNDPSQQLARLRKAGLPFAAFANGQAGSQSALPQTSGEGVAKGGAALANYVIRNTQMEQLNLLKAQVEKEKADAAKAAAETKWLLEGAGQDSQRTNYTSMLSMDKSLKSLQNIGTEYANTIAGANARNIGTKISLENTEHGQRIANMIQSNLATKVQIDGYKLDNALKDLELKWKPKMNTANLDHILKQNDILVTEKGLKQLQYDLDANTFNNRVAMSDIQRQNASVGLQLLGVNYEQSKEWQEFNRRTQKLFNDNPNMSLKDRANAVMSMIYQTIGNPQGKLSSPIFNFSN